MARACVFALQLLQLLLVDLAALTERDEPAERLPRGFMDAQFEIAQRATADAGRTSELQPRHAQGAGANLHCQSRQRRRVDRTRERTLAQIHVAQRVPFRRMPVLVRLGRHRRSRQASGILMTSYQRVIMCLRRMAYQRRFASPAGGDLCGRKTEPRDVRAPDFLALLTPNLLGDSRA